MRRIDMEKRPAPSKPEGDEISIDIEQSERGLRARSMSMG